MVIRSVVPAMKSIGTDRNTGPVGCRPACVQQRCIATVSSSTLRASYWYLVAVSASWVVGPPSTGL